MFLNKSNNVKYECGTVMFMNYVKPEYFNRDWFKAFVHVCGDFRPLEFYSRLWKGDLGSALRRLHSKIDVKKMLKDPKRHRMLEIYLVVPS